MRTYYPNAITKDGQRLFVDTPADSLEKGFEQFDIWDRMFPCGLSETWMIIRYDDDLEMRFEATKHWILE